MTNPFVLILPTISNLIGMIASHPIIILKVRLQNEILRQYDYGFKLHLVLVFYILIYNLLQKLFEFFLNKQGYEFMNVLRPDSDFKGNLISIGLSMIGSSIISFAFLQLIYFYQQRLIKKKKQQDFFKDIQIMFLNRNSIAVVFFWGFSMKANKERFKPQKID
ncbi:unnamed protein product [Paramecium sonneborni]|uniref:Transmembrane protein n=1 Tax=Paramecium sonneborni TaxID=65129 RepID=A0A8S1KD19_9CILI|nr:unnamed protein product [Paramecium sonneborni]